MKNARLLRQELELWKVAWQQVETFLDQVEGAQDKDDTQRRRMAGLLRAVRAVEHVRARTDASRALGDPVVTRLPSRAYRPHDRTTDRNVSGWDEGLRAWRLPGADEVELAVGLLRTDDERALEEVTLPGVAELFERQDENGSLTMLTLPTYPADGASIVGGATLHPAIAKETRGSLFTRGERKAATLAGTPAGEDPDSDESHVRAWSTLARTRRAASRPTSGDDVVRLSSDRTVDGPPWGDLSVTTLPIVEALAASAAAGTASPGHLDALRTAALAALAAVGADAADLLAAQAAADDEGLSDPTLAALLGQAATALGAQRDALESIADEARLLRLAPSSSARTRLGAALATLQQTALPADLVRAAPEETRLGAELDLVVGARVEYPGGTLRSLRTLETGFVAAWPGVRRSFVLRHRAVLAPTLTTFYRPFVSGLRALLRGGFTGMPCEGLELESLALATVTAIGSEQVDLVQPASLTPVLADLLEPGHLGVLAGDRPAPVVVLGVTDRLGHASLQIAPLRLSTAPPTAAPGPVGTVPAASRLGCAVERGLTARELRRGRSDAGPGHDALVREALGLYSRLALLLGGAAVERLLQGLAADAQDAGGVTAAWVPEPAPPPALHGIVPGHATTLVIHGLGAAFWEPPGHDGVPADALGPEPRVARPGEFVLLRGRVKGDGGRPGGLVQAPVEVDEVVAVTGRALARMDTTRAGVLSTDPSALPPPPAEGTAPAEGAASAAGSAPPRPPLVCGPDEPLALVLLKRSWAREALVSDVEITRSFRGFDAPSLATRTLLPASLVERITGAEPEAVAGVSRGPEFTAALDVLDAMTRYGR